MPHVIIEHTESITKIVKKSEVLKKVHLAVVNSGLFNPDAVKSRTISYRETCWNKSAEPVDFAHVTVKILAGRTIEQKQALSQSVFKTLSAALPAVLKLSVDIQDMAKETYCKN